MAKEKKKIWPVLIPAAFVLYVFAAARPVPRETILIPRWLSSLESEYPVILETEGGDAGSSVPDLLPFTLGDRFGYVDAGGRFALNRIRKGELSLSADRWAEYPPVPQTLEIRSPYDESALTLTRNPGYPFLIDGRIFIVGSEMNSVSALDGGGNTLWAYDFSAPLTCADAAAGFFLAGSVDGRVELLDSAGVLVFPPFEPGGSRKPGIMGCALSRDGSRIAVISGADEQRFLLLERGVRTGSVPGAGARESYRVIYHEFLSGGFRRPVYIEFIDHDNRVAFEREGGVGIYDINTRTSVKLPLEGTIRGFDGSGVDGLFFVTSSLSEMEKRLVAIRLPGKIILEAPFKSETAFLGRKGGRVYVGGGMTLVSFGLGKK